MRRAVLLALLFVCACTAEPPRDADAGAREADASSPDAIGAGGPVCGNGALEPPEECEPSAAVTARCADRGLLRGWLRCGADCRFDTTACYSPRCGDGEVQEGEVCDDGNLEDDDGCPRNCAALPGDDRVARVMEALLSEWDVPGGAIAVAYRGRLVYARGFGTSDEAMSVPTDEALRFRIGSLSKPITSVAIHTLIEAGRLAASDHIVDLLPVPPPASADPRWADITVEHLLTHQGGFDPDDDPMFSNLRIADDLGVTPPVETDEILRWMYERPLDYAPGTRFSYANFGYALLGLVVESVTGQPYADYVRERVLGPMGIERMVPGASRVADRGPDETYYFVTPDRSPSPSVFAEDERMLVRHPDGGFYVEGMTSMGGWTASVIDLARFLVHVDGEPSVPDLLSEVTTAAMLAAPPENGAWTTTLWYARGWYAQPVRGGLLWSHNGVLSGTNAAMVRDPSGLSWVAIFNKWPNGGFLADASQRLHEAALAVPDWPDHDLFALYP